MLNYLIIFSLLILISCCIIRQKRYLIEIALNTPSASIKTAYKVSVPLVAAWFFIPTEVDFFGCLTIVCMLCIKATISPTLIAITLFFSLWQFCECGDFAFYKIWSSIVGILLWRLPEEVRTTLTAVSLIWSFILALSPRFLFRLF